MLNAVERVKLVGRALLFRAALPLVVSRTTLPQLLESLSCGSGPSAAAPGSDRRLQLVERVLRPLRFWRTTCLYRALGAYALLRSAGEDVRFLIGVRAAGGGDVEAHAWLERNGKPSLGAPTPEERFVVAYAFPVEGPGRAWRPKVNGMPALRPSEDVILTEMEDGTGVLLHLQSKYYYTLNATGVGVWKLLAAGAADERAVADSLAAEYASEDAARVRGDVAALVRELLFERLLLQG